MLGIGMPHKPRAGAMNSPVNFTHGARCDIGTFEITPDAIARFAAEYDPQAQHLDEAAAKLTPLQGLSPSGWHTCILAMRQIERFFSRLSVRPQILAVEEIRWLQPVRPGETASVELIWSYARSLGACAVEGARAATITVTKSTGALALRINCALLLSTKGESVAGAADCANIYQRTSTVRRRTGGHLVRYFDDVLVGDEITFRPCCFDASSIEMYRSIVDDHITDIEPSSETLPSRAVCGWHPIAKWTRQMVDYYHSESEWLSLNAQPVPLLGPAIGVRSLSWHAPVYEGDCITFTSWVDHKVGAGISKDWGMLVLGTEGINRAGTRVVSFYPQFLLQKRPGNSP